MKLVQKRSRKAGLPPGTLVHIGEKKAETVPITVFQYDADQFHERQVDKPEDITIAPEPTITWVDVGGIHKVEILESFGKLFGLHPLLLEDIANSDQRPKLDDFGTHVYVVLKMLYEGERHGDVNVEQVSLVFGENFLLSFQENGGDVFQGGQGTVTCREGAPTACRVRLSPACLDRLDRRSIFRRARNDRRADRGLTRLRHHESGTRNSEGDPRVEATAVICPAVCLASAGGHQQSVTIRMPVPAGFDQDFFSRCLRPHRANRRYDRKLSGKWCHPCWKSTCPASATG